MKKTLVILLLFLPFSGYAASIQPLPESFFEKVARCHVWIPCYFEQNLGATVTTIAGSDTLSASRTTINTNFSNINTELLTIVGTTTNSTITTLSGLTTASALATVGTITSGTWSGTTISVAKGGTNLTSYTAGDILYATGATTLAKLGIGSPGEVLFVSGSNLPDWDSVSVNQTLDYAWTGVHNFVGSATYIKALTASTTLTLSNGGAGYSIIFPATQSTASSTVFAQNGSGTYANQQLGGVLHLNTSPTGLNNSTSSTTVFSMTVPANTLSTNNVIHGSVPFVSLQTGNGVIFWVDVGYGNGSPASTTIAVTNNTGGTANQTGKIEFWLSGTGATNTQKLTVLLNGVISDIELANATVVGRTGAASLATDSTAAKTLMMVVRMTAGINAVDFNPSQAVIELLPKI